MGDGPGRGTFLRHQAITELCEAALSDMTIMGIAGHVSKEMLMHYSHIRMKARREAVATLETAPRPWLQSPPKGLRLRGQIEGDLKELQYKQQYKEVFDE